MGRTRYGKADLRRSDGRAVDPGRVENAVDDAIAVDGTGVLTRGSEDVATLDDAQ